MEVRINAEKIKVFTYLFSLLFGLIVAITVLQLEYYVSWFYILSQLITSV